MIFAHLRDGAKPRSLAIWLHSECIKSTLHVLFSLSLLMSNVFHLFQKKQIDKKITNIDIVSINNPHFITVIIFFFFFFFILFCWRSHSSLDACVFGCTNIQIPHISISKYLRNSSMIFFKLLFILIFKRFVLGKWFYSLYTGESLFYWSYEDHWIEWHRNNYVHLHSMIPWDFIYFYEQLTKKVTQKQN